MTSLTKRKLIDLIETKVGADVVSLSKDGSSHWRAHLRQGAQECRLTLPQTFPDIGRKRTNLLQKVRRALRERWGMRKEQA